MFLNFVYNEEFIFPTNKIKIILQHQGNVDYRGRIFLTEND